MKKIKNDIFLKACKKQKTERTPIWIMRQAGRYLPQYRKIRAKADFLKMCKTPELAAEVTIQPVDILGVDAAIIFSDILVIPEAMGMKLIINEGKGPQFPNPIRHKDDVNHLKEIDAGSDLKYVMDAISLTKKELNGKVPLIGFSGSPWTLITYMVEGGGTKNFSEIKKFIYNQPKTAHQLLDKIARAVTNYLSAKIEAGADAIQIFDTWGGILSPTDYQEFSLQYITQIISELKRNSEPVIIFAKGVHNNLKQLADTKADVISIDWTISLEKARKEIGNKVALQGNLDPTVLYANKNKIKQEAIKVLESFGKGDGHIFNLGHGISPDIPPENAKYLVTTVKKESKRFHID
ncbi:uroporphyrinogen decarboxylase [Melioribacteraceae bacterium 4301-Me]|uniref:uroporphyrinogen decarboxylase n=1 Tax=Pyranulibacter aquaticus TaxID=3163344 RepID=UPI00359B016E